ncbi:RHS repeat-associated core domain-containing protein [Niastella caeni]|uniref:RHS repeat-associated core domain-containing protein n=1 Tax=Niastella caeni TaxID=2569763 RepID=A0A4V4H033_9BACT|nr:RHS repeat-associated core domain-containing protein [Niastella caeni]THU34986.1 RHS repeat-associated core domain-containing protein [Niastella caeni]
MQTHSLYRIVLLLGLICTTPFVHAGDGGGVVASAILDGSKQQVRTDSSRTIQDSAFFNASANGVDTGYSVQNVITLKINEASPLYLRTPFTATVQLRIIYSNGSAIDSISRDFTINYDSARSYHARNSFVFHGGRRVTVRILSVNTHGATWDVASVLMVENQLMAKPKYVFSCTNTVTNITVLPSSDAKADELQVQWTAIRGADQYDVEWTYIDSSALANNKYGNPLDPALIFLHNATRISTTANAYSIPVIYDNSGTLFIRVRPVQIGRAHSVVAAIWSSDASPSVMGQYQFTGHERLLNWQSNISFAEEGKRKVVVQYFDGSLRNRQTVTKDNTTNNTIVAETFYDYQGRPAIQVIPSPSLKNVIQYKAGFNVSINHAEYSQSDFDSLYSPDVFCTTHAEAMSADSGASLYYSRNNPNKTKGLNQFIPDAKNYPFTETEYTQDNTGRISRQGGVGPDHQLGSGHETKYFYGTPDQNELDALFGTDAGDKSHYFKNMVRDDNGQYSVSYVDMHGRTIATALAGNSPGSLASLASNVPAMITENLADAGSRFLQDWSMINQKSLVVPVADTYRFNYRLDPKSLTEANCRQQNICYTCLYDLQITITDNCNNRLLPGGKAFDTVLHNFSFGNLPGSCSPASMNLSFSLYLPEGSYQVTKSLTVNRRAFVYYRDSVYLPNNTCISMQQFITEQRSIIAAASTQCAPDCRSCRDSVGTYEQFKNKFITRTGIAAADTAAFSAEIATAYKNALASCNDLCGDSSAVDNDIRSAMLQDMTPPYGQYADTAKGVYEDLYSIFYIDPKDTLNFVPVYRYDGLQYADVNGRPDYVYNLESDLMVEPGSLSMSQFVQNFRSSWAEALLPYHPEYCKLQALEAQKAGNIWDRQMEAIDNFRDARELGYLNPTGNAAYPYPIVPANIDPLSLQSASLKNKLQAKLAEYLAAAGGNPKLSLWAMACVLTKCDSGNVTCVKFFGNTPANVFDTVNMCDGDLDMAWRNFRQLYLGFKQDLVNELVNNPAGCTPLNAAYTKVPKNADLIKYGHQPQFNQDTKTTVSQYTDLNTALQGTGDPGKAGQASAASQQQFNQFYEENINAMVNQWATQLSPCAYSEAALRDTILPRLKGLCVKASDKEHPFGASTLPAGITYTPPGTNYAFTSFEHIINTWNQEHNITNWQACNADLITSPQPYDRQPVYNNKPVLTKPSGCECQLINDLYIKYRLTRRDATFAAYLTRTQGITMSDSDLRMLRELCSNEGAPTAGGAACVFLKQPIYLPPSMQCNAGEVCASCTLVDSMYRHYIQQYPGDAPQIADPEDTRQNQRNQHFQNYMNNRLGFSLQAWEYLQFLAECQSAAGSISNTTECVDQPVGNIFLSGVPGKLEDIQSTPDAGYIMVGSTGLNARDASIIKTDNNGNVQWAKKYGGNGDDQLTRVRRTSDNGYIAIGTTKSDHYATGAMWVVKMDAGGTVQWTKTIGFNTYFGERGYDVIETSDGGYAALGIYNQHTGHGEFLLSSLTSDGGINWVRRFGTSRLQEDGVGCSPGQPDTLTYDGAPGYSLLEKNDTLLIAGAAYDVNMGNRYFGAIYRVNKYDGNLLDAWHYADSTSDNKSTWFRNIYATPGGYMITAGNAENLGTTNDQMAVVHLLSDGTVSSYKRFNLPAGSNKITSSAVYPASDGGYIVAQTGNNGSHIFWQRMDASGSLLWSTETALPGNQTIGRLIQNNDSSFTLVGANNQQMLMLNLHHDHGSCYDNAVAVGVTNPLMGRINWSTVNDALVYPEDIDFGLTAVPLLLTNSVIACPGNGNCYNIYNGPLLCGKSQPLFQPIGIDSTGICTDSTFFAVSIGTELHRTYTDSLTGNFEERYINTCLQAWRYETFTVTHTRSEYHHTLYYYDQAGNLVRTVPPAGVHAITDTTVLKQVKAARAAGTGLAPAHTLVTDYRYNTLNQVVAQRSPDGGTSRFWYDRLGRLSVSQNAIQKDSAHYSYTKYDVIGRVTEVAQLASSTGMADGISRSQGALEQWLTNAAATATQITKTTYDVEYSPVQPVMAARNLRNRVSWTALYNTAADLPVNNFATATFYSYDILGNVDTLLQDYRIGTMGNNLNRFKKIAYDYDLISGKVNQVSYQPGQPDAFYHRYEYDAENRITNVLTSADSINWDNDAFYQYYDHGLLARTILGEQQVQGINYAYNLMGWTKSINPDIYAGAGYTLKADGSTGSVVGKTAYNVMLNYFNGDYKAISGAAPSDTGVNATLGGEYRPLYNGNISSMAVTIGKLNNPLLSNYQYDQLNRLVAMDAWQKTGVAWRNLTRRGDFQERVRYDANGNILGYKRNGNNTFAGKPLGMDSLTYKYIMGTNRLDHISDSVQAGNYDTDIDRQSAGNYEYDAIGNLVKDRAEGINKISWTVYGKISRIIKSDGTNISYTYDAGGNRISKAVVKTAPASADTTWYVRDAQGNVMSVYASGIDSVNDGHLTQTELHVYGSSRIGLLQRNNDVTQYEPVVITMPLLGAGYGLSFGRGNKLFELSNHLGNVLATISDKKIGVPSGGSSLIDHYEPQVVNAQDYYPFGMVMPGRTYAEGNSYRYGFNGKENDAETKTQDYGFRIYNPALGRFLSVDPLTKNYPWYTPYQFAGNKPINSIDLDGLEEYENYEAYSKAKGKSALKTMDGSDGAWLASDRKDKKGTWSNAMAAITKNKWKDKLKSYSLVPASPDGFTPAYIREDNYSFGIVRDYYNWVQHELDAKGFGSQWAKGASYLSDELADTYEEGAVSGSATSMGGILKGLSQGIAGYAVGKFSSVLYGGETVPNTEDGWYAWDANFVMEEQVTKVAPSIYQSYAGTNALNQLNSLSRKEGFIGGAASLLSKHFFPSFAKFGVSVNDPSTQFGAQGRYNIPLLMLYPYTHQAKGGVKLSNEQFKEIMKAHNAINSYYKNSMKY